MIIKILGMTYTIEMRQHLSIADGAVGRCSSNINIIEIDSNIPEDNQKETLLHEIIEALNYRLELGLEHATITRISQGLFAICNDNGFFSSDFDPREV